MRLAAVYSVFDGEELLEDSIRQIRPFVNYVIASFQTISYHGEPYLGGKNECERLHKNGLIDRITEYHTQSVPTCYNESMKRLAAVDIAKELNCSHFMHIDCDEYYIPNQFVAAKDFISSFGCDGSVVNMRIYFKQPTLAIDDETLKCPFIHSMKRYREPYGTYPFNVDPTRATAADKIMAIPKNVILMHHYAWVRKNIELKIRASASRGGIENTTLLSDYYNAIDGYYIKHYNMALKTVVSPFQLGWC